MSSGYQKRSLRIGLGLVCLFTLVCQAFAQAEERVPVPAQVQVPLILKVLTFDRNVDQKMPLALRIAIVYDPQNPVSEKAQIEIAQVLDRFTTKTFKKRPIQYSLLQYDGESILNDIDSKKINVLYIMPGNAKYLQALLQISQNRQITTVTGVPEYVKKGVAVGIGVKKGRRRPRIMINLPASKSQGSAFEANLLRVAQVLH